MKKHVRQAATSNRAGRLRLVIYTVLVGTKEGLNNPLHFVGADAETDLDIHYVCFTDNDALLSPTWQMRHFSQPLLPVEKMSRLPKAQPALFFPDFDYSLYIDNTVVLKRLPRSDDIRDALFRGFRHPWRSSPLDEADIVVKAGLDAADVVAAQVDFYASQQRPLDEVGRLTAGTVLLRRHHDARVLRFGDLWWQQILLFSKRDQLSLDLCAREAGCPVEYFDGDKTNNELFVWPILPDGRRIQGSFDAERYAWAHRSDPLARQQPKQHFLQHGGDGEAWARQPRWFNYACDRAHSSLGDSAAPRRGIADVVGRALARLGPGAVLVMGVQSSALYTVEAEELLAAQAAIVQSYRFVAVPQVVIAAVPETEMLEAAPFQGAGGVTGFVLVIVLGLTPPCIAGVMAKVRPLLGNTGQVLLQFGDSLDLAAINRLHESTPDNSTLEVFHGNHITVGGIIPANVVMVAFQAS